MREAVHGQAPSDTAEMSTTPPMPSGRPAQDGEAVSVRLLTPFEIGGKRVQWSAIRTDTPAADVAFAINEFEHMLIIDLAPGTYAVEGINEAEGIFLAETITVTAGGENSFEIPVARDGDRSSVETDHGEDVAFVCTNAPGGCEVRHEASGISLMLPNSWTMGEPYFYETAGARADLPTATFFAKDLGKVVSVELNPRQWLESNGPCRAIGANQLCMFVGQGMGAEIGFEAIASSLQISPSRSGDVVAANRIPGSPSISAGAIRNPSCAPFSAIRREIEAMKSKLASVLIGLASCFGLAPAAHAQAVQIAMCMEGGCSCHVPGTTLADVEMILGMPNPAGAADMTLVIYENEYSWRSQTPEQIDASFGGPGQCPIQLEVPLIPEDGMWRITTGATDASACPLFALAGQAVPGQMSGETREIRWRGWFSPANSCPMPLAM
ncbi:hypothetical protein [Neoaquamicrobium sediminum]|uniref:hypothetical protein n=1 Tax=Neoaquamicrobium sediminum TaxID=1849104 RepID=UPI0015647257|nr:hypothetical protein [Mesorhizobium sediminum]NRC52836.1 hypothetical protein [Mesorhizobium sediminum]